MTATTRTATSTRFRKLAVTGVAALGAAAAALTIAPSPAHAAAPAPHSVAAATVSTSGVTEQANSAAKAGQDSSSGNLDGWIRQSLDVMKSKGIPGSYEGLHRNIMRESGGNPNAANGWDVNAQNGTPSKGLLQVIQPTFDAYHVSGTKHDLTDPVANITAAAQYAADKYGSIDNVDSAY
ncbi:transglycosylase SLT domain-containing protein [Streptomyces pinistramenti]|uniref:transglycosylase SLT domain-containing protein n=1 Tax=Streptomyces pinistramenti TaxID=2884812 RepID=UPI001D0826BC|nr:transglycosylase SLT domain-containing protein [Streptomyces pinistramenti]MCB5909286.1 transglycosylase SLT domain-containing protein [Streptomyces pinistramenti]